MSRVHASLTQSDLGLSRGNFDVIVDECRGAVVHYWHPNVHLGESWIRTDCFDTNEPHPRLASSAQKIVQHTGEFDREGWNGIGTPTFAVNRTENRFGIIGTDLGTSFSQLMAADIPTPLGPDRMGDLAAGIGKVESKSEARAGGR
jgi:hypothetical protein